MWGIRYSSVTRPPFIVNVAGPTSRRTGVNGCVYSDEHHSTFISGNVILTCSTQPPNPRYLAAWDQAMSGLARRVEGPICVVTIIDSGTPPPDEASRKAIRHSINKHRHRIAALAYVVEGHGFGAAALRSVLSVISLTARYPFPQKIFATTSEASAWVAQSKGVTTTAPEMLAQIDMMRGGGDVGLAATG